MSDQDGYIIINQKKVKMYAGFWKRLIAYMIDSFIIGAIQGGLIYVFKLISFDVWTDVSVRLIFFAITSCLYYAIFESSSLMATPSKLLLRMAVVDYQYQKVPFWRTLLRSLLMLLPSTGMLFQTWGRLLPNAGYISWISIALLAIVSVPSAFTKNKQGIHDLFTNCLIVNRKALLEMEKAQALETNAQ